MYEEKKTIWKKKGFYLSLCAALLCCLAMGTVYYKMNGRNTAEGEKLFADSASEAQANSPSPAGGSAVGVGKADSAEVAAIDNPNEEDKTVLSDDAEEADNQAVEPKEAVTQKPAQKKTQTAQKTQKASKDKTAKKSGTQSKKTDSVAAMSNGGKLNFQVDKGLLWPVQGEVLLKYSTNNTIYFKTLAQYKCNPAIAIGAEIGTKVKAAADGVVTEISEQSDIGKTITVDIGSGYTVLYGQVQDIKVAKGDSIKEGDVIAKIAQPTKYYSQEGSNLYFQVKENKETVDPLLLLR